MTVAVAGTSSKAWAWVVSLQLIGVNGFVVDNAWMKSQRSMVRACFQTYWERSTNFVCNEKIRFWHSVGEILFCKIVPFKTNIFISIMFEHTLAKIRISQESIMDPFEIDASPCQIMGDEIFFWNFAISVAIKSSLLNYVFWNWKKIECIYNANFDWPLFLSRDARMCNRWCLHSNMIGILCTAA